MRQYPVGSKTPDGGTVEDVRDVEAFVRYPDGRRTWRLLKDLEPETADVPEAPETTSVPAPERTTDVRPPRRRGRK